MRSRDERKADFERRETIRKAKYAEARARQTDAAAARLENLKANRPQASAPVEPRERSVDELDMEARARLAQPSVFMGEGGSPLMLPFILKEMRQTSKDLKRLRDAKKRNES